MKHKKLYIVFSLLLSFFCFSIVPKTFPNDTFSAIRIGDYILHNGIDFVEHFNFNELSYHNARWLFNIIVAFIYNHFNFLGIYIFTGISCIILGLIMFNSILKKYNKLFLAFFVTFISLELICSAIVARAQTISYILFFLEVIFIEKLIKENNKKYIISLVIISILVANIHTTTWPMVLILFLPYFAEYFIHKIFKNNTVLYSETNNLILLSITFIIIAFTGLITPLGLTPYTYMFKTLTGFSSTFILELQKINPLKDILFVIVIIIYLLLFIIKRKKIKISDIFMILGLIIMSIMAVRNIPIFIVIGSICLSRLIIENIGISDNINIILDYFYSSKLFISIICIFIVLMSMLFLFNKAINNNYVDEKAYPIKASDFIVENIDLNNIRLYNAFDYGSYLEFRGIKVFLDSRSEVYCKEFNDTTILEDWYNTSRLKVDYKKIFNKYNFNYLLLYSNEPLNNVISDDKDYKIIYSDNYFVLYEKVE